MRGRDRKGPVEREWKQRNFIHDFPRVPEVKHFGQCALVRARDHWLAAWYLADKVAQSCVHYEIRGPEEYQRVEKVERCSQTRRPITPIRRESVVVESHIFLFGDEISARVMIMTEFPGCNH